MADKRTPKEGAMRLTTYDSIATAPSLQELVSLQLCRGSNLHKDNDGWANCRPVSADLLYTTLDTSWAQFLVQTMVIGSGQFQDKQPQNPLPKLKHFTFLKEFFLELLKKILVL